VQNCAPPLQVGVEDVARIGDALAATRAAAQYLEKLPEDLTELRRLARRIGDFDAIAQRIRAVIDERARVRDDASPKLHRIRTDIQGATQRIRIAVDKLLHDQATRRLLQFPNYTFHEDRVVFPVRAEYRGRLPGIVHRSSDSGATIYVEPSQAVELNNEISNLRGEENEEISRLLWELAHEIYINVDEIVKTLDALAVLDLLVAKMRFAADFEMRIPQLNDELKLDVRGARHPLLIDFIRQKNVGGENHEPVVPISYRLGDDFDMLVITGPNTGGKTVALKTIGLLTLMVQAGLPVPIDEGGSFGVFKRVMIDVGDEQSMQQSLSTFSSHLKKQMEMLNEAGSTGLVLIDELGAGTDPDEGAAIGRAILDELLRLKCRCIATTHIGALKSFPLTRPRAENGCVEFDTETLKPTYVMRIGEAGMSNAIAIAQRLGMPRRLIQAAERNLSRKAKALRAAMEGAAGVKREAERARHAAETAQLEADRAHSAAEETQAALAKKKADFEEWVKRVVHLQAGDAVRVRSFDRNGHVVRMRLDQHRAEVDVGSFTVEVPLGDVLPPETPAPPEPTERRKPTKPKPKPKAKSSAPAPSKRRPRKQNESRPAAKPRMRSLSEAEIQALTPGDYVAVKRLHRNGRVSRVELEKQIVHVNVGAFEVEVPYSGLARPEERHKAASKKKRVGKTKSSETPGRRAAESPPDAAR